MRVLLVDDHPLVREGMKLMLQSLSDATEVMEAADFEEAVQLALGHDGYGLAVVDLNLPGLDAASGLPALQRVLPCPLVVISGNEDPDTIERVLALGVNGYIPKSSEPGVIARAIDLVLAGGVYLPPVLLRRSRVARRPEVATVPSAPSCRLTQRELAVLHCLVRGLSNKEIARELDISSTTVRTHICAVFRTLEVNNRTKAALEAKRRGLLDEDDSVEPELPVQARRRVTL